MERSNLQGNFLLQIIKGRWMMIAVGFYILSVSGATYIFGIYSGTIKSSLHYNQETIGTLGFFKDLGGNIGVISGLINEVAPAWFVLAIGAFMNIFGYLMIWMAVTHRIHRPSVALMSFYICVGSNSQTFSGTGVLVTCVKNFPQSRGVVLGLVKGCIGLSGAIFTQVYHAIYGQDATGIILLIGWLPSLVTLMFMFFIRPMKPQTDISEGKHFFSFLYLALSLAGFLMAAIILENVVSLPSAVYKLFGAFTLLIVAANVLIAISAEHKILVHGQAAEKHYKDLEQKEPIQLPALTDGSDEKLSKKTVDYSDSGDRLETRSTDLAQTTPEVSFESDDASANKEKPCQDDTRKHLHDVNDISDAQKNMPTSMEQIKPHDVDKNQVTHLSQETGFIAKLHLCIRKWPKRGEDFNIPQAILSLDMFILFISIACGVGATLTAIDNMGQIGASLGYSPVSISTCVSLISIWNFLGRVGSGFISEYLLQKYSVGRPLMLSIVMAIACVGHILIAYPAPGTLYVSSILVGMCFGAQMPVLFAVISELFGLKYYATLHNVGALASPLGSYLLNVRVAGFLYDKEARRQQLSLVRDSVVAATASLAAPSGAPVPSMAASVSKPLDLICDGVHCFRLTFVIMTIVSAFGSLVAFVLFMRTKRFYSEEIYPKLQMHSSEDPPKDDI